VEEREYQSSRLEDQDRGPRCAACAAFPPSRSYTPRAEQGAARSAWTNADAVSVFGMRLLFDRQIHGVHHASYRTNVPFKLCSYLAHWSGVAHQPDQCLLLGFSPLFRGDPAMMI